jgi:hypothetical protein
MIALFTALALLLEARVTQQVDDAIDDGLRARATDVAAGGAARFPGSDARFTEVLPGGTPYGPRTITRTIEGERTRCASSRSATDHAWSWSDRASKLETRH